MILLADADILVYQAASKCQENFKWDDEVTSVYVDDLDYAKEVLDKDIANLMRATKTVTVLMALSSSPNFRYEVLPTYKHNRKDIEKPVLLQDLRNYLLETYPCKVKPRLEGDDVIGIMATKYPEKYLIASIDKDLKQIKGKHYNWRTEEFFEVTEHEGDFWFYYQTLVGDPGDGYSGCPGIGKVKALKILNTTIEACTPWANDKERATALWNAVKGAYISKDLTEEDALVQARVARILRHTDWDFKKHEVILWKP